MHIGDQLVDRLIAYGIRHVFGCPGGQTLPLYNAIAKREGQIEHVLMHDERSGAYAADGYARSTGTVSVCDATVGPGASNLVSGLAEAYSSSIPILAIVSDIPREWERYRHLGSASQAFEQRRFLEGCGKWYGRVEIAENLPEILHACIRIATAGRPGPVVLEIPADVFAGPAGPAGLPVTPEWAAFPRLRAGADPDAIERALECLDASRAPMIVAGGGALHAGAGEAVLALAGSLSCPVATTLTGKGIIPETHALSVGVVGRFGVPVANTLLARSDCMILIGCKAGQSTTLGWTVPEVDTQVIHIDVDPEEIGRHFPNTVGILADARIGTAALALAVRDTTFEFAWDLERMSELLSDWWDGPIRYKERPKPGVLKPQDLMRILGRVLTEDDVVVCDASLASGWAGTRLQMKRAGRQFFAPRGLAGLGWGLPAAIGIATARSTQPDAGRTVCLAGDGAWGYSMAEVETAARRDLPIVSVILNNSTLGWIKHASAERYHDAKISEDFREVEYAAAAQAMGANAVHVDTLDGFERALRGAMDDTGPVPWVIEATSCDVETPIVPTEISQKGSY